MCMCTDILISINNIHLRVLIFEILLKSFEILLILKIKTLKLRRIFRMYTMNIDLHTMNIDLHKVLSSVPCVNIVLYQKCRNEQKQLKYL